MDSNPPNPPSLPSKRPVSPDDPSNNRIKLRRVAEIVMVLSATAAMRGGKPPTAEEMELMAEARENLVGICRGYAPVELFGREKVGSLMEDLGVGLRTDDKLGFRGAARLSIKDKLLISKRKMEESKKLGTHSHAYSPQAPQQSFSGASENRGVMRNVHMFPSDKTSSAPQSSAGIPASSTQSGYVPPATSISVTFQPSNAEGRASTVSTGSLQRVEKTQVKPQGRLNGIVHTPNVQVNASVSNSPANFSTWSIQPHSASSTRSAPENKVLTGNIPKTEGSVEMTGPQTPSQATRDQAFRSQVTQPASANIPSLHQPTQGMKHVQQPAFLNNHIEIAKIVQKILQPEQTERPTWNTPSREYMSKGLTCQMCRVTANEVETVVICDACEKGYHLRCLESTNQKGIPRGEWHCSRCTALSNGKPLPPKYGRVMRSITPPKAAPNQPAGQPSLEKKVGVLDPKVNPESLTSNGSADLQNPAGSGIVSSNHGDSVSFSGTSSASDVSRISTMSSGKDVNLEIGAETSVNDTTKTSVAVDLPQSGLPGERTTQQPQVSESPVQEESSLSQLNLQHPTLSSENINNNVEHSKPSGISRDIGQSELSNSIEVPLSSSTVSQSMVEESHGVKGTDDCTSRDNVKQSIHDATNVTSVESSELEDEAGKDPALSCNGLRSVEWVGDALKVEDEKRFYESCCISGKIYKVQDYALCRSVHEKLVPYKLKAMWEDTNSGTKWVAMNQCYFPSDLPDAVGRPGASETNEVYESNHQSSVMAGLIQGPCEVLPPNKFKKNSENQIRLGTEATDGSEPVFLCKWFYDELKGSFQPVFS